MSEIAFLFDLGSPYAYLSAERLSGLPDGEVEWRPILLGGLFKANGRSSWGLGPERDAGMAEIERRAREYGLPPLTWPDGWPADYLQAQRAAVVAAQEGLARAFALAGFRAQFAQGRHLTELEAVLDVAADVGLDRDEVAARIATPAVKQRLIEATADAHRRGVPGVPTVLVGDRWVWGDDQLESITPSISSSFSLRSRPPA